MAVLYEKFQVNLTDTLQVTIPLQDSFFLRDLLYTIEFDSKEYPIMIFISTEQPDYKYCQPVTQEVGGKENRFIDIKWHSEIDSRCNYITISSEKPVNLYLTLKTAE